MNITLESLDIELMAHFTNCDTRIGYLIFRHGDEFSISIDNPKTGRYKTKNFKNLKQLNRFYNKLILKSLEKSTKIRGKK